MAWSPTRRRCSGSCYSTCTGGSAICWATPQLPRGRRGTGPGAAAAFARCSPARSRSPLSRPMTVAADSSLRARTALARGSLSRPIGLALDDGLIVAGGTTVLDYGCGRGGDVERLGGAGVKCSGWDPHHRPDGTRGPSDLVNLGYVVNVIEDLSEREATLRSAWELARQVLLVSARLESESPGLEGTACGDGLRTSTGTFQKLYSQVELRDWIDTTLGVHAVAAAPGVFFVFREPPLEQVWLLRRVRRSRRLAPLSKELMAQHEELLHPLIAFVAERGRLPRGLELESRAEIERQLGSLRNAFAVVRR